MSVPPINNSIDPTSLQLGLRQLLRSYASAGLRHFDCQTARPLDWDALQLGAPSPANGHLAPTEKASATQTVSPATARPVAKTDPSLLPTPATTLPTFQTTPANSAPAKPAPIITGAKVGNLAGSWHLPDMDDVLRAEKLNEVDQQVRACRKCSELVCYRRQTVFGEGHIRPRVCFFGEAPGADEDAQGRPFVGAAGKLLTDIIRAMKLTREEVYILNSLKCRPPQNRTPLPEEVDNCRPFALTQLEILQPEFIILLGSVAVRSVLQSTDSVGRLRGRFHQFHGAKVLVTYHPAYLLRTPSAKKMVWQDVQMVMQELG